MEKITRAFLKDESGQDLVEYALLLALITLAAATGMGAFANTLSSAWGSITGSLGGYFGS